MSPVHQVWPKPSCKALWKGEDGKADRKRGRKRAVENREKWRKPVVNSSVVPQRPLRLRDRWRWSLSKGWYFTRVFFHQVGHYQGGLYHGVLSSGWSLSGCSFTRVVFIRVVFHQGSLSSGWSFTRVVFIRVVFHQGGLYQGGLSPGCSFIRVLIIRWSLLG